MNSFNAIGRVGKDAVVRHTGNGKPVTGWSLAVDSGFGDNKVTLWFDCSLWGERGEKIVQYITKGSQVGVVGELGTRDHEGKTYLTLKVAEITLVGGKKDGQEGGGAGGSRGGAPHRERPQRTAAPASRDMGDDFADDDIPFVTNRSTF